MQLYNIFICWNNLPLALALVKIENLTRLCLRSYHSDTGKKGGKVSEEREGRRHNSTQPSCIPTVIVPTGIGLNGILLDPPDSPHRSSTARNPYMYPIMELLAAEAGETVNSFTPPSLAGRNLARSRYHSENGGTCGNVSEGREMRRRNSPQSSRIPLPRVFSRRLS